MLHSVVYRLIPKNPGPNQLVLTFGWGWRLFFAALGGLLARGMFQEATVHAVPFIITVILFLAAAYRERWVFDRDAAEISYSFGLVFAYRTKTYPFGELEEVLFRGTVPDSASTSHDQIGDSGSKRFMNRGFVKLGLNFAETGPVSIQTESNRNAAMLRNLGTEIARFCDVPYRDAG